MRTSTTAADLILHLRQLPPDAVVSGIEHLAFSNYDRPDGTSPGLEHARAARREALLRQLNRPGPPTGPIHIPSERLKGSQP